MQQSSNANKIVNKAFTVCVLIVIGLLVGLFGFKQNWCLVALGFFFLFLLFGFVFLSTLQSIPIMIVTILTFQLIGYVIGGTDFVIALSGIFLADIAALLSLSHRVRMAKEQERIHQSKKPSQLLKAEKDVPPKAVIPTKVETKRKTVSTCTHCGAAVTSVDAVICEYCDCVLDEIE